MVEIRYFIISQPYYVNTGKHKQYVCYTTSLYLLELFFNRIRKLDLQKKKKYWGNRVIMIERYNIVSFYHYDIYKSNMVVTQYQHKHVCYTTILCLLQLYIFRPAFISKQINEIDL